MRRPTEAAAGLALVAAASLFVSAAAEAAPITITAIAQGFPPTSAGTFQQDVNPATGQIIDAGNNPIPLSALPFLTYGSFTVNGGNDLGSTTTIIGDGINDETWWVFNFIGNPDLTAFIFSTDPLISAALSITLIPRQPPPFNDGVFVPGLNGSYDLAIAGAPNTPQTLMIDLVQPGLVASGKAHPASDILNVLIGSGTTGPSDSIMHGSGQLPFKYIDDSHVVAASLTLTRDVRAAVPEPATLALFSLGLAGIGFAARRKRNTA